MGMAFGETTTGAMKPILVAEDGTVQTSATLTDASAGSALTDRSFQATGTSASKIPALATRKYLFIQNQGTENVFLRFGAAAVADRTSIRLTPGAIFVMEGSLISTDAIYAISASGTQDCAAWEA